jgi:hypothetical protein
MFYMSICFVSITILTWYLNMTHFKRNRLWSRLNVGVWPYCNVKLWSFPCTQVWHHVWREMWSGGIAAPFLTGGRTLRWWPSFTLRALYPRGKSLSFPLSMGMGGSEKRSGCLGGHLLRPSPSYYYTLYFATSKNLVVMSTMFPPQEYS